MKGDAVLGIVEAVWTDHDVLAVSGSTVGAFIDSDGVLVIVGCTADTELHVELAEIASREDVAEFVAAVAAEFMAEDLVEPAHVHQPGPEPASAESTFACDPTTFKTMLSRGVPLTLAFAGRCLHVPTGTAVDDALVALERFLASGRGRVLALAILEGSGRILASSPPSCGVRLPDGLAVYEAQWARAEVGGVVGPLGTARVLSTWNAGLNTVSTAACQRRLNSPVDTSPPVGGSVGDSAARTRLLALAEATERYVGGVISPHRVVSASRDELGEEALDPREVVDYLPWQYDEFPDLHPFDSAEKRLWVAADDAVGTSRFILADLVFYPFGWGRNRRHTSTSSSGMAAHLDLARAREAAVNELIERDAFMRLWLSNTRPPVLEDWHALVPPRLADPLAAGNWTVDLFQMGRDASEPVVLAVGRRGRSVALGASAATPRQAVVKAVGELWATTTRSDELADAPTQARQVQTTSDHTLFALAGNYDDEPEYLRPGDEHVSVSALADRPTPPAVCFFYDWDDVDSRPFCVTRALAPELIPMSFGFGQEPYGRHDVQDLLGSRLPTGLGGALQPHMFP